MKMSVGKLTHPAVPSFANKQLAVDPPALPEVVLHHLPILAAGQKAGGGIMAQRHLMSAALVCGQASGGHPATFSHICHPNLHMPGLASHQVHKPGLTSKLVCEA